jgi:putative ABC transport system permease protein
MLAATLKGLVAHRLRLALTALAVVIGVAFVAGTLMVTDSINRAFDSVFTSAYQGTDAVVRGKEAFSGAGNGPVPADLVPVVAGVDGVRAAQGFFQEPARILKPDGKGIGGGGPPVFGQPWSGDPDLSSLRVVAGRAPTGPRDVVLDTNSAGEGGFQLGQSVRIELPGGVQSFNLVGLVAFGTGGNLGGATIAAFEDATAKRVLKWDGQYDEIDAAADSGVSQTELAGRIARALPATAEVVTGDQAASDAKSDIDEGLGFLRTALLVFAAIALFVGAFIIVNTFSIIVAQRTRELALLRALGATPGQVTRMVRIEALIVGLVSSVIGLFAGIGLAKGLVALFDAIGAELPAAGLRITAGTVLISIVLGTSITLLASYGPSRRAARVSPMAALRDSALPEAASAWRRLALGAVATALGVVVLLVGLAGDVSQPAVFVGAGALLVFIGVGALSPLFARPAARILGWPLSKLGIASRLGRENAMRNPRRTASTAAALMIGLGLVTFVSIFASSVKSTLGAALKGSVTAGVVVSSENFEGLSPDVAARLRQVPQVAAASEVRFGPWQAGSSTKDLQAVDPATIERVSDLGLSPGAAQGLAAGGVLVYAREARKDGLEVGDTLAMRLPIGGVRRLRVAGTYTRGQFLWGNYLISLRLYERGYPIQRSDPVLLAAAPGVSETQLRTAASAALSGFPSARAQTPDEWQKEVEGFLDSLLNLIYALLGLAIIIAVLGIVNTLALSILERTREIGLLRAVGLGRRQTRSMVRSEAVIVAVFGALLGLVVGLFFGWAMTRAIEELTEFTIPWTTLAIFVALSALAGVLAALGPARRAARMDVLRAIATE